MAVRLFVGNMPYGATEADLRAHFAGVGEPSQVVIPTDRDTGRPRGFAFVEFQDRAVAEQAIQRFNQNPFMGRTLSVSEARPREERGAGGYSSPRPTGGFGAPRPSGPGPGAGGFRPGGPPRSDAAPGGRNFGPPKKKGGAGDRRWEDRPKGPIKERYTGRLGALEDVDGEESPTIDFDDPASREENDADE